MVQPDMWRCPTLSPLALPANVGPVPQLPNSTPISAKTDELMPLCDALEAAFAMALAPVRAHELQEAE